jgi:dihydropyrimidinase
MDLLIKNGRLVLAHEIVMADLLIECGKISRIEESINLNSIPRIDAEGAFVMAAGIDPHVHLSLPTPKGYSSDDFHSGSQAALAGGTTCFIDFVTPEKGENLKAAFLKRKAEVRHCYCDFAFHMSIVEWRDEIPDEMEVCVNELGITSFKTYLAYQKTIGISFELLEKTMNVAKNLNVSVTIHAELGNEIDQMRSEAIAARQIENSFHAKTRPDYTEYKAVEKVIELVKKTKCETYIVHVSTADSLNKIQQANKNGIPIYAETCPQYFTFNDSVYAKEKSQSNGFVMSPPIRSEENRKGILNGIVQKQVLTIGTDHCPFSTQQKNAAANFSEIPNGAGGIQHRLAMVHAAFVHTNQVSMIEFSKLVSAQAAQFFRLENKGEIRIDFDADLVILRPVSESIGQQKLYSKSDIDIYANELIYAKPAIVIKGGYIVFQNDHLSEKPPRGKYIHRK